MALLMLGGGCCWAGRGQLEVLDLQSREVRKYEYGTQAFRVDLRFVRGWSHCTGRPLKSFEFLGRPTVRAELFCFTLKGAVASSSCVVSNAPAEVVITSVLAEGAKFTGKEDAIDAVGGAELTVTCWSD